MDSRRPTRAAMESLIREHGGVVKRIAAALGVSRPTTYKWVYQMGLDGLVGIAPPANIPRVNVYSGKHRNNYVNLAADRGPILGDVSTQTPAAMRTEPRVPRTVSVRQGLWRRARVRAAETDSDVADVVEQALEVFLGSEKKNGGAE